MATVRIIAILRHLGPRGRFALAEALERAAPGHDLDPEALYEQFLRELDNISPLWLHVPDGSVGPNEPR